MSQRKIPNIFVGFLLIGCFRCCYFKEGQKRGNPRSLQSRTKGSVYTMSASETDTHQRLKKMSEFFKSDIFIIITVVAVILIMAICVFCCIRRRRQAQRLLTQRLTEIVVVRDDTGTDNKNLRPKYTMKIRTDQRHATKLLEIVTGFHNLQDSTPVLQGSRLAGTRLQGPGSNSGFIFLANTERKARSDTLVAVGLHDRNWTFTNQEHLCDHQAEPLRPPSALSAPAVLQNPESPEIDSS